MVARSERRGLPAVGARKRDASATSATGSPARRGASSTGTGRPSGAFHLGEHLAHGPARAGAQVEGTAGPACEQALERAHVRVGEIRHVHEVALAAAVARRPVVAEQPQRRARAGRRAQRERDQVGLRRVALAEAARRDRRPRR